MPHKTRAVESAETAAFPIAGGAADDSYGTGGRRAIAASQLTEEYIVSTIATVHAREILDSRGNPTIEVDVRLADGGFGRAAVPSGASTGSREAHELRDGDPKRFSGKGVTQAVANVTGTISPSIIGTEASDQVKLDEALCALDGTTGKHRLGANALLGVSMAVARAAAASARLPLYRYLGGERATRLPVPMFNVLNGGAHADNNVELQEFMVAPIGATSFREALRMGAEVYQALKSILKAGGYATAVGDEGGFAPKLEQDVQAIELILQAIERAGFTAGRDVVLALDPAASELFEDGAYRFKKSDGRKVSSLQMIDLYEGWTRQFPIASIEDGLAEDDWEGWQALTARLGERIQLVGDDIFVTDRMTIRRAIDAKVGNAALIKLNQIGTVTETRAAMAESRTAGWGLVISHRSGETPDDFIADFAVGTGAGQIKIGSLRNSERLAKYNQLSRIAEDPRLPFAGREALAG